MFRFRLRINKQIKEKVVFMMATSGSITCNSLHDFLELSNGELQYYLQQRGLPMSGTRGTLAARALIAREQKIECVATAAHLSETLKSHYGNLLSFFWINCFQIL